MEQTDFKPEIWKHYATHESRRVFRREPWEASAFKGGGSEVELPVTMHACLCMYVEE